MAYFYANNAYVGPADLTFDDVVTMAGATGGPCIFRTKVGNRYVLVLDGGVAAWQDGTGQWVRPTQVECEAETYRRAGDAELLSWANGPISIFTKQGA